MQCTLASADGSRVVAVTVDIERSSALRLRSVLPVHGFTAVVRGDTDHNYVASESAAYSGICYARRLLGREDFSATIMAIAGEYRDADTEAVASAACLAVLRHHGADASGLDLMGWQELT